MDDCAPYGGSERGMIPNQKERMKTIALGGAVLVTFLPAGSRPNTSSSAESFLCLTLATRSSRVIAEQAILGFIRRSRCHLAGLPATHLAPCALPVFRSNSSSHEQTKNIWRRALADRRCLHTLTFALAFPVRCPWSLAATIVSYGTGYWWKACHHCQRRNVSAFRSR